ncbi:hypothetical protein VKT23_020361 [Stygiomarasmius scandens]|uniref:BZIP domain-containing protein n=1 Tax=Marasmiellus scandens TaxID=2682957 RepID=A0ABR1IL17_9AGAR
MTDFIFEALHLTGAAEYDYLISHGVDPSDVYLYQQDRKQLRTIRHKRHQNAMDYLKNRDSRLTRARENNARRRQEFSQLSTEGQHKILEERRLSQEMYRRHNRELLAAKERERRAKKKAASLCTDSTQATQ